MADELKITSEHQLALTKTELETLKKILDSGDRGAFHFVYATMADNDDARLTAKISTFSDTIGGTAFAANWYLEYNYGVNGINTEESGRYTGVYVLSQKIAKKIFEAVKDKVDDNLTGVLTEEEHFNAAAAGWEGIEEQFPGNFIDAVDTIFTDIPGSDVGFLDLFGGGNPGIEATIFASLFAHYTGKQLTDFSGRSGYTHVPIGDGILVVDERGRVAATFINGGPFDSAAVVQNAASIVANSVWTPYSNLDELAVEALTHRTADSDSISSTDQIYRDARIAFNEFDTTSGYTGAPQAPQALADPILVVRPEGTEKDDILFAADGSAIGGEGDDLIFGRAAKNDELKGDGGDDTIWGREGDDELHGGAGDDILRGGAGDDIFHPGSGSDVIDGGDITTTRDDDGIDTADYSIGDDEKSNKTPVKIILGEGEQVDKGVITIEDGPDAQDLLFSIEKIIGSDVGDTVELRAFLDKQLENLQIIDGGKNEAGHDELNATGFVSKDLEVNLQYNVISGDTVQTVKLLAGDGPELRLKNFETFKGNDGDDLIKTSSWTVSLFGADPLVLDLDGLTSEGLNLSGLELTSPRFDIDGDGFAERTGWIGEGDALLARDIDGDGKITSISELFGTNDTSGFAVLSELDSVAEGGNEDGVINVDDVGFADLRLWVDAPTSGNGNALTDPGELKSLAEYGIVELSLAARDPDPATDNLGETAGNEITGVGEFRRQTYAPDGSLVFSTGLLADVSFVYESTGMRLQGATI